MAVVLSGCVGKNVELRPDFWSNSEKKIALVLKKPPVPAVYKVGEQGIIDIAINTAMNSRLSNHLKNTDLSWYSETMPQSFESRLKEKNFKVSEYEQVDSISKADYPRFLGKTNSDLLLLIQLQAIGVERRYFGFIPTSDPKGYCSIEGQLIDVKNKNKILWRYAANYSQPVTGRWKQPPTYPNLTQSIETARKVVEKELLDSFFADQ